MIVGQYGQGGGYSPEAGQSAGEQARPLVGIVAHAGSHSAAGQMTGYLYQCELALLKLAERAWDDEAVEVRMEVLDDIEFLHGSGTPQELLQSKHRSEAGQLSETGKDFWRSVASWIDALILLDSPPRGPMPLLRLVTTQVAAEHTFLHMLRPASDRRVSQALTRMEEIAGADGPENTAKDRRRFLDLTPAQRYQLVDAMEISDGAPLMSDLDSSLAKALGIRRGQHRDAILDQIKGWWYRMAVELLERKDPQRRRASVSAEKLLCRRDEITDQFAGKNLPITESWRRLTDAEIAAYGDQLVVTQMRWIGLDDLEIATHLRDYHHARAQRSEWIRTFEITEDGLKDYERQLWDEWDHIFLRRTRRLRSDLPEADRQAIGQNVLDNTMDVAADKPARPGSTTAGWIGRGTMHSLADRAGHPDTAPDAVGWHPNYTDLCRRPDSEQEQ